MSEKESKIVYEGIIIQAHKNGMFRVRLDNGNVVLGYISGKIRQSSIYISLNDRVQIEISNYDLTRGRIIYRFPSEDSSDDDE